MSPAHRLGWFSFRLAGSGATYLLFHDNQGHQTPDLYRTQDGWSPIARIAHSPVSSRPLETEPVLAAPEEAPAAPLPGRASAQLISYELAMGLSAVGVLMSAGSLRLTEVVLAQDRFWHWNAWSQPVGVFVFIVAAFAETNRLPFDMPECESELVGGYHTEYSSMKFAMFFMAEYANMVTASALMVTLFFGGWQMPGLAGLSLPPLAVSLLQVAAFLLKTGFFLFFFVWVRWTLPRFRFDQLMDLGWKAMLPLALLQIFLTSFLILAGWI